MMKYDVYTAGPLFTSQDLVKCDIIESICTKLNLTFFSPRIACKNEGKKLFKLNEQFKSGKYDKADYGKMLIMRDKLATKIFVKNIKALTTSRLIVANIDNRDQGTMVECGYAFAKNMPVVTCSYENFGSNVMLQQKIIAHINNIDLTQQTALINLLTSFFDKVKLTKYTKKDIVNLRNMFYKMDTTEIL